MNIDESDERRHWSQGHGIEDRHKRRAERIQRHPPAFVDSSMPPFPPEANFDVPVSFPLDAGGPGVDLSSMPPRLTRDEDRFGIPFDVWKPTCSINLICHRNGALQKHQVQVIDKSRCGGQDRFESLIASSNGLIQTDEQLFERIKNIYERKMYGTWRSMFSFKTLREIRLASFSPYDYRPVPVFLPEYVKQDMLFAYRHPEKLHSDGQWIQWVFNLRQPHRRFALEFVEGWSALRILIAVSILLALSTAIGIALTVVMDDAQTAFTIASFVICAGSLLLAALAIVSSIEVSNNDGSGQSRLLHNMNINHNHHNLADGYPLYAAVRDAKEAQERDFRNRAQDYQMQQMLLEQQNKRGPVELDQNTGNIPNAPSLAEKSKRVHSCGFPGCKKSFTRREHCRRHELGHKTGPTTECPDGTGQEDR